MKMQRHTYRKKGRQNRRVSNNIQDFSQKFDLLRELVNRDLKIMYKRTVFGILWTLINPIMELTVFVFVFEFVLSVGVQNYASFVFIGLLVWNWFQTSVFQSATAIVGNRSLIRQPNFPPAILPISTISTRWVHFMFAMPILMIFLLFDNTTINYSSIIIVPFLMVLQFLLSILLGYLFAALNVIFRDTQHTIGVVLQLMFFLTGIFYEVKNIPPKYEIFYNMNPMVHIIGAYRSLLIDGTVPPLLPLLTIAIFSLAVLPLSYRFFQRQSVRFVEEL